MTPMRHSFTLIDKLLASPNPEQHVLEIRTLIEELVERARDSAEEEAASIFGKAMLSYLRGIGLDGRDVDALRRREVDEKAEALAAVMLLRRGQTETCTDRARARR